MAVRIIIIFLLFISNIYSQQYDDCCDSNEVKLQILFNELRSSSSDSEKVSLNNMVDSLLTETLSNENSFLHSFDSLKYMGKIYSPDSLIRIYSWNILLSDGSAICCGFIQRKKADSIQVIKLSAQRENSSILLHKKLKAQNWYDALYYEILISKFMGRDYYILLGYNPNDAYTNKKIIDVLYFENDTSATFGYPLFAGKKGSTYRVIFEYSENASMMLKYHKKLDMIVFDHLSPAKPQLEGQYEFYGPDLSYDGYKYKDGMWVFTEDVDYKMTK